ncbi:hypothetical protein GALL_408350 [mine drainage metagenome]|uniref:Uncharacterized protein n=1 Tax=mine drainage metagenome TaxID=410659 RepID=A0A1J5QC29_9ZZZZ
MVRPQLLGRGAQLERRTQHIHALQAAPGLGRHRAVDGHGPPLMAAAQGLQHRRRIVQAAEHEQGLGAFAQRAEAGALGAHARRQAQRQQRGARQQRVDEHDGAREIRQPGDQQRRRQRQRGHAGRRGQAPHVGQAGVAPGRAVGAETQQAGAPHGHRQRQADGDDVDDIGGRVVAEQAEAEDEGGQPGQRDDGGVAQGRLPADAAGGAAPELHAAASAASSSPRARSSHTRSSCAAVMFEPEGRQMPPANSAALTSCSGAWVK